jgi:hypothetical protein
MKSLSLVLVGLVVFALAGCGGEPGGGGSGSNKHATIDITVSGAISGHSTQLDSKKPADCLGQNGVKLTGVTQTTLFPVINGKIYSFNVSVNDFKSAPMSFQLPDKTLKLGVSIEDTSNNNGWTAFEATGSVVINSDINSGKADIKHMLNSDREESRKVDLTATWSC